MIKSEHAITIELPIGQVMELFGRQDYFKHWQPGLIDFENLTGTPGTVGSTRKMKIKKAGTVITMKEEITAVDLPDLWEATYRTKGVVNFQKNRFRESETTTNNGTKKVTIWEATTIFKFSGLMRLVAKSRPQLFMGQTEELMQEFKKFAESH
jgi:UDP-N-acetylenolpyruvoylglucosamine reductase